MFFAAIFSDVFAQLPDTDIWLIEKNETDGKIIVGKPLNITSRKGYDNQPMFSPDQNIVYYSSIRENGQSDIYAYNITLKSTASFCTTPESEYSPTITPDLEYLSVVRVEKDSTQRLWKFPLKGGKPELIAEKIDSIGYHAWSNKDSVAVFVLTNPFSLQLINIPQQRVTLVDDSIGKCMLRFPSIRGSGILYVKESNGKKTIFFTSLKWFKKNEIEKYPLIDLPVNSEYFTLNKNILYCTSGSKIFKYELYVDKDWIEIADLSSSGLTQLTRITINRSGNKIAVVNTVN